jgi:hypothetical protein
MVSAISNAIPTQPVQSAAKSPQPAPQSVAGTDSVTLSLAAQAALAATRDATETPSQTAQEASHGDLQARRLLAREAAEKLAR